MPPRHPLQNNLHELWALLNFLLPEVFSSGGRMGTAPTRSVPACSCARAEGLKGREVLISRASTLLACKPSPSCHHLGAPPAGPPVAPCSREV